MSLTENNQTNSSENNSLLSNTKNFFKFNERGEDCSTKARLNNDEFPYSCTKCHKKFKRSDNMKIHVRSKHTQDNLLKCQECDYETFVYSKLANHMKIHLGKRLEMCKFCSKSFWENSCLSYHVRTHHTRENMYKCNQCSNETANLKRHTVKHSWEQPYHVIFAKIGLVIQIV